MHKVCGESISRGPLDDFFSIERPFGVRQIEDLKQYEDALICLKIRKSELTLTGTVLWYTDEGRFVLFLSPLIRSSSQLNRLGLSYDDFSIFDSSIDNIAVLQTQKSLLNEAQLKETVLLEKNQELKKANASLDRFVYHVSHELKSPVINLQSMLRMLKGSLVEHTDARVERIMIYGRKHRPI